MKKMSNQMKPMADKASAEIEKLRANYNLLKAEIKSRVATLEMKAEQKKTEQELSAKMDRLKRNLQDLGEVGKSKSAELIQSYNTTVSEIRQKLDRLSS